MAITLRRNDNLARRMYQDIFSGKALLFGALFVLIFALFIPHSDASPAFTVRDIEIDVTARNAVQAKDQAYERARLKAFDVLARRLLSEEQYEWLETPDDITVSSLIKDFEVLEERLSSRRYIGKFLFRFEEEETRRFLSEQGLRFSDISAQPLMILPYLQIVDAQLAPVRETGLFTEDNIWLKAWQIEGRDRSGLVPITTPIGNAQDLVDFPVSAAMSFIGGGFDEAAQRYKVSDILIAQLRFRRPDNPSGWTSEGVPVGETSVIIYRRDFASAGLVELARFEIGRLPLTEEGLQPAVGSIYNFLQSDWKAQTAVEAGAELMMLDVNLYLTSVETLVATRQRLNAVEALTRYEIISLAPGLAVIRLNFRGHFDRLALSLEQQNLSLDAPSAQKFQEEALSDDLKFGRLPAVDGSGALIGAPVQNDPALWRPVLRLR